MTISIRTKVFAGIDVDWKEESANGALLFRDATTIQMLKRFSEGVGSGEANQVWHTGADGRDLVAGLDESFDLHAMIMPILGKHLVTFTFIEVRAILVIVNTETTGAALRVGPGDTNPFIPPWRASTNWNNVGAGSPLLLASFLDGYDVNGAARMLKIANASSVDVNYDMAIVGTTTSSSSSSGS